jgi:diguanylate cyclase (GGDEF)-like protein
VARADSPVVPSSLENIHLNKRLMAYTSATMYGAAALDGLIEGFLPGDPEFSRVPVIACSVTFVALLLIGPRLPKAALALLGPFAVALVAYAVGTTPGAGDGAVLYALPVLWVTLFFGWRGALMIIACVGAAHAITLLSVPAESAYMGRWADVMVSVCSICAVVLVLADRNALLLGRLAEEARTDDLTGLLNRRGFADRVSTELLHAKRDGLTVALAAFDIDHFKRVNDQWGHEVGDRVLGRVGALLTAESRDVDIVARLGGEEFVVLLPGVDGAGADAFTTRVRLALASNDALGLPVVQVSAGIHIIGVTTDIETMLRSADSALYEAKRAGRNRTVTYRRRDDCADGPAPAELVLPSSSRL